MPGNNNDDIDLLGLLERVYLYLRRFTAIFLVAIIIGIALGCAAYFLSTKIYESKLILHSSSLTNQEELEIIDYWDQLLQRHEYKIMAPILNCDEALLSRLVSLEGVEIQKNYSSTDPNGFYVMARVTDNAILPELQNAIVYGLNNTELVRQKIVARREDLTKLIERITAQIAQTDSLKHDISILIKNGRTSSVMVDVTGLDKELVELNEKLVAYKNELKFLNSVQVLQGFIPLNTPVSRSLRTSILLGLVLCIVVAYLFTVLKYIEDRLKKRVKSHA